MVDEKFPPIDPEKLRELIAYSFRHLGGWANLTIEERSILTVSEYEALRAWAFGRT